MKNFLLGLLVTGLVACSEKIDEKKSIDYIPELVITDSIAIDKLTPLAFIDIQAHSF
jgi:hypothetical protein